MNPNVLNDAENEKFFMLENDKQSYLEYEMHGTKAIEFKHTFVPEDQRDSGKAEELVEYGLKFALNNHLKVIPTCSFVKKYIENNMDKYSDLLEKS